MDLHTTSGTLYYDVVGDGPALVIPGHASTARFADLAQHFADDYTVVGFDLPHSGGRTRSTPEHYSFEHIADDCRSLIEAAGFTRAHYLGLSHTGLLGMALALRHPDVIDRLVLSMTTPGRDLEQLTARGDANRLATSEQLAETLATARTGDRDAIRRVAALSYSPVAERMAPELIENIVRDEMGPQLLAPEEVQHLHWRAMAELNARERLGEIDVPTLVLTGAGDRMVELEDSWAMWRGLPNATLVGLEQVGHDWYTEAPALGARVVRMFLAGQLDPPRPR